MTLRSTWSNVNEWMREAVRQINPLLNRFGPISAATLSGNAGKALVVNPTSDGLTFGVVAGSGSVTSVSVTTANGVSGTVATATTTPAITVTLGAITPSSVAASGTVTGSNLSGTNTGDQTTITGNAGTATTLQTARLINGVSFNGSADITINAVDATARLALTGGTLTGVLTVSADGAPLTVNSTNSNSIKVIFQDAGTVRGYLGANATGPIIADSGAVTRIQVSTTGASVAGTFNASGAINADGGAVKFPATQVASADANTLDDYEEGTFTPTLRFGGLSAGMTASTQEGRYTKIGRRVFFDILIVLTAKGTSTGVATIGLLPFAHAASPAASGSPIMHNTVGMTVPGYNIAVSDQLINLTNFVTNGTGNINDTNFADTTTVRVSGSYDV